MVKCGYCQFWIRHRADKPDEGECRARSPFMVNCNGFVTWPLTDAQEGCKEGQTTDDARMLGDWNTSVERPAWPGAEKL